jgi:hypothetical protein
MAPARENSEKASSHAQEHHGGRRVRAAEETAELVFTVNANTGAIVKVEKIDSHRSRAEITNEELIALADKDSLHDIETVLDEAYEAGISSVLEPEGGEGSDSISDDEVKLRHDLLTGIIGQGVRDRLERRLVQRLILSRALSH